MKRRNLNEFELGELSKKMFDAQKKSIGGDRKSEDAKNQRSISTADANKKDIKSGLAAAALAKDFGISVGQMKHSVRIGNAFAWMYKKQLGRRNLPNYERARLALQLKETIAAEAKAKENERKTTNQKSDESSTKEINTNKELAKVAGVSHDTIHKVDVIEQKATPRGQNGPLEKPRGFDNPPGFLYPTIYTVLLSSSTMISLPATLTVKPSRLITSCNRSETLSARFTCRWDSLTSVPVKASTTQIQPFSRVIQTISSS